MKKTTKSKQNNSPKNLPKTSSNPKKNNSSKLANTKTSSKRKPPKNESRKKSFYSPAPTINPREFKTNCPEAEVAIANYVLPHNFSAEIIRQGKELKKNPLTLDNRKDLRHLPFVTIDGEDAKDFDDAVYGELISSSKGITRWRLFVAIADVSFYVTNHSPIDDEAYLRSTSVYFPRLVVPMLPPILSEDLCSLVPNKDRAVMVCEMEINEQGNIENYKFYAGIFNSQARFTYNQVENILFAGNNNVPEININKKVHQNLKNLKAIYWALRREREERGALDIDSKEYKFTFKNNKVTGIYQDWRGEAHKLIEECMIAANICSAKFLENNEPTLFRNHLPPSPDSLETLKLQLADFGIKIKTGKSAKNNITPQLFAQILTQVKQHQQSQFLQYMVLRSLKNAVYAPTNLGHFGLGLTHYTHFTSPIRRYPDLLVHRAIKKLLLKNQNKKNKKNIEKNLLLESHSRNWVLVGEHCSVCEKRADSASRDANMMLRCELAKNNIGETIHANVAGVTKFGVFVQLEKSLADGLIPMKSLGRYFDDYVEFDEHKNLINIPKYRKSFGLGTEVLVRVNGVNSWERRLDLELISVNL